MGILKSNASNFFFVKIIRAFSPNERQVYGSRHCRNVDLVDLTTASPRLGPFHKLQIEHLEDVFLNFGEVKIVWCQVGWYGG